MRQNQTSIFFYYYIIYFITNAYHQYILNSQWKNNLSAAIQKYLWILMSHISEQTHLLIMTEKRKEHNIFLRLLLDPSKRTSESNFVTSSKPDIKITHTQGNTNKSHHLL